MSHEEAEIMAVRLRTACDLFDTGVALQRQQLRREHPDASSAEIEQRLAAWLQTRPGAEHGDAPGRPVSWPSGERRP